MKVSVSSCVPIFTILILILPTNHGSTEKSPPPDSKNILFYMGCGSYSMRISMWPLIEALTDKGHNVTFISPYQSKSPNPRVFDFVPKNLQQWWNSFTFNTYEMRRNNELHYFWFTSPEFGVQACARLYEDPEILNWIQNSKYDLVIIDSFMNDCAYGLAYAFNAKTIVFSTTTLYPWFYEAFGIPDDSAWVSTDCSIGFPAKNMNFFQRTANALLPVVWKLIRYFWYFPKLEEITKQALKLESVPSFAELEKNTSLIFLTTHYAQEFARALPPNVVPIGGLGLTGEVTPLPREIEEFIDKGKQGFVYISFGTIAEFSTLDKEVKEEFIKALLQFPHVQFIWKLSKGVGVNLPENFLVLEWAPQQSLLAHPKIKGFLTHGGVGGVNEATYYAVPLIAFPIFAEQDHNSNLVEAKGVGVKLEITTLKSEQLQDALRTITESRKIKENMLKASAMFRDRPQSSLETAVWWTEYVLRHEPSDLFEFLRPDNTQQSWFSKRQLDVWLFVLIIVFLAVSVPLYIVQHTIILILGAIFKPKSAKSNNKSKQH